MRAEFERLVREFPRGSALREPTTNSPLKDLLEAALPQAIRNCVDCRHLEIDGSIGKGEFTHTPWVALLDPAITTSVQEEYYIVYLLSKESERLYLSINQGCTTLRNEVGQTAARNELERRANVMRKRVARATTRLVAIEMDLNVPSSIWRGKLYEHGSVVGVEYNALSLPAQEDLEVDLREAIALYRFLKSQGGWESEDTIVGEANSDGFLDAPLEHKKQYRLHRSLERRKSHSDAVKRMQGTRCRGCDFEMGEIYGSVCDGLIHAHHLRPLSELMDGEIAHFDPRTDFAVLCPNCHSAIHKLADPGDLEALRTLVAKGQLGRKP